MGIDILAIGAHPDDIEIGAGGTLLKHQMNGQTIALCELTLAELSSNGDVQTRQKEAERARALMGASKRIQLHYCDRNILVNDEHIRPLVRVIRQLKPRVILAPYWEDRHPDHEHCSHLVREAVFSAGIKKYAPDTGDLHQVDSVFYYFINNFVEPDFCIDITEVYERKMELLQCYESQFSLSTGSVETPLNTGYFEQIRSREYLFGRKIKVGFAEGFKTRSPISINYFV